MTFVWALTHYLFPGQSNNHRARILHASSIFIVSLLLLFLQFSIKGISLSGLRILGYASNIPPLKVAEISNQKRVEAGLSPLEFSQELSLAARLKGEDMLAKDYWAHVSPDGITPWKFFTDVGYKYRFAGENLARDFSDPASAIAAWMASPSHRDNLLSEKYKEVGIAVVEGDLAGVETTLIVQLFGAKSEAQSQIPIASAKVIEKVSEVGSLSPSATPLPTETFTPTGQGEKIVVKEESKPKILISPFSASKGISSLTIGFFLVVLTFDGIIVSARKVTRIGGRTFAHLAFLGMILVIVLLARAGEII